MELPVRIGRPGVVKGRFQNGNLRLIQIKGEEMWKGWAEYEQQISRVVNIVCFAVDICWTILCKTFLRTNEKRMTLSGSPWPKWSDGIIHGGHSGHHPEVHLLLSVRLWTAFPHYQCCVLLSLVPVIPHHPQGESRYFLSLKSLVLRTTEE